MQAENSPQLIDDVVLDSKGPSLITVADALAGVSVAIVRQAASPSFRRIPISR